VAKKTQSRAVSIEHMTPAALASMLTGAKKLVVAIDIAKTKMMTGFAREDGETRSTSLTSRYSIRV